MALRCVVCQQRHFLCVHSGVTCLCAVRGSLLTRSLGDIVKKEHFVLDSEYLITLLVVVPKWEPRPDTELNKKIKKRQFQFLFFRTSYGDWEKTYETLAEMVVPRSSKWVVLISNHLIYICILCITCFSRFWFHHNSVCISTIQYDRGCVFFIPACYLRTTTVDCIVSPCLGKPLMTSNTKPERTSESAHKRFGLTRCRHTERWEYLASIEAYFCRLHVFSRFIVRDFQYNEEEMKADKEEMTRLSTDKKKQFVSEGTNLSCLYVFMKRLFDLALCWRIWVRSLRNQAVVC